MTENYTKLVLYKTCADTDDDTKTHPQHIIDPKLPGKTVSEVGTPFIFNASCNFTLCVSGTTGSSSPWKNATGVES